MLNSTISRIFKWGCMRNQHEVDDDDSNNNNNNINNPQENIHQVIMKVNGLITREVRKVPRKLS